MVRSRHGGGCLPGAESSLPGNSTATAQQLYRAYTYTRGRGRATSSGASTAARTRIELVSPARQAGCAPGASRAKSTPGRTSTCDLAVRSRALYAPELQGQMIPACCLVSSPWRVRVRVPPRAGIKPQRTAVRGDAGGTISRPPGPQPGALPTELASPEREPPTAARGHGGATTSTRTAGNPRSGWRDLNARSRPWQGRGLPTVLQPHGADDGSRTRNPQLGKLVPYRWATSASAGTCSSSQGELNP